MGWKSTKTITRDEAIYLIEQAIERKPYEKMSNEELEEAMRQEMSYYYFSKPDEI